MATYVIGDLQGCYEPFRKLLEKVHFNYMQDALWLVGDLVNRGPESLSVLRFLRSFKGKLVCVLGNHDLHFLSRAYGCVDAKKGDTLEEALAASDLGKIVDWLRQFPLMHYDADLNTIMVHAGIYPEWPFKKALKYASEVEVCLREKNPQYFFEHLRGDIPLRWDAELKGNKRRRFIVNAFTRMRIVSKKKNELDFKFKSTYFEIPPGFVPWYDNLLPEYKTKHLVFGHWAALSVETNLSHVLALDKGCVWGESLMAVRLEDGKVFLQE